MNQKYYRFMERPEGNWQPYRYAFIYGSEADAGSHLDELFIAVPERGNYLFFGDDGQPSVLCPTSFAKYNGVVFADMPPLEELLDEGIVVEVPEDIQELDWKLQARIASLEGAVEELEERLEELEPKMYERRFFMLTQEARTSQHVYHELQPALDLLYRELGEVRGEMEAKVIGPLAEQVAARKERLMAGVDDLIFGASARGLEVLGMKKDFDIELGPGK